jgi:histidyl-tRNA synthetase
VLGGGRYDGLIENLGGPATPAVGWAAGIERLAMLVDAPEKERLVAILALEDDRSADKSIAALAALRRAGLSADIIATGSPRKRYDKAAKISADVLISVKHDGDKAIFDLRSAQGTARFEQVEAILKALAN